MVNAGLLILKETGIFWFSFPSAGAFMKRILKGRQIVLQIIKKRKYREILQTVSVFVLHSTCYQFVLSVLSFVSFQELEKRKLDKSLELPLHYIIHDLIGGKKLKW